MTPKKKRRSHLIPEHMAEPLHKLCSATVLSLWIVAVSATVSYLVMNLTQEANDGTSYRFCLATATSDSCVLRPGVLIGDKISNSPDKLMRYFRNIPDRVQMQWRVWIMDDEKSLTSEVTVAEFYKWIENVWNVKDPQGS